MVDNKGSREGKGEKTYQGYSRRKNFDLADKILEGERSCYDLARS